MRRIFIPISSLVTSFALALSGLVFSPANAAAPADGTYACGSGTYKITTTVVTDETVRTFSDAGTCSGDVVIPEGVTTTSNYAFGYGNSQVTSVSLPESLTKIGNTPFYGTGLLTEINVASNTLAFASVDGVLFGLNGTSASLIAYPGSKAGSTYTTPDTVSFAGGSPIPVTRIEAYALQGAKNLTALNISEGVTTLGYGIAESATLLSTINLPDSYTAMTDRSLGGAIGLTALTIGKFLTSIQETSFTQTNNLNSITVDPDNPNYSSLDGVLFNDDFTVLLAFPQGKKADPYVVPAAVTHIGNYAFDSSTLASVSLPEGVTHIGNNAFWQSKVSSISLPDSLIEIAREAFQYSELTTVTIPENVVTLGQYVFNQAFKLTSITVDADNPNYSSLNGVLFDEANLNLIAYPLGNPATSYTIPSGVQTIGERSFQSSQKLTSVFFPSGNFAIESEAFSCASDLKSFIFLGDAPTVGDFAFGCISDPKAYIKSGNTTFTPVAGKWNGLTVSEFDYFVSFDSKGGSAVSLLPFVTGGSVSAPTAPTRDFYGFTGWSTSNSVSEGGTAVAFPYAPVGDITLFANWFEDGNFLCSGARAEVDDTNIYNITGGVVSSGGACTGDVVIPDVVTHIGNSAFTSSPMTSISLPDSLIEIGQQAFLYTELTTITIPKNVSTIGIGVFQNAFALTSITVAEPNVNYTSSSDGVLFNEDSTKLVAYPLGKTATTYTIPSGVNIIGDRAFMGAPTLSSVIIPSGVTTVEDLAFFCTSSLKDFYFLGNAPETVSNSSFGCGGSDAKAHVKNASVSSFALVDGKWNGLTVEIVDPPTVYVVTYNSSLGSTVAAGSFAAGGQISAAPVPPRRTGYTFAGWSATNGGSIIKFPYTPGVSNDITLYAKWTKNVKAAAKVKPTVSGTAKVGKTLTANKGTWTGSPKPTHSYQWYVCTKKVEAATSKVPSNCKKISGAIGTPLKLTYTQKGKYITVLVTGTSTGTTKTTWMSKSTGKVG